MSGIETNNPPLNLDKKLADELIDPTEAQEIIDSMKNTKPDISLETAKEILEGINKFLQNPKNEQEKKVVLQLADILFAKYSITTKELKHIKDSIINKREEKKIDSVQEFAKLIKEKKENIKTIRAWMNEAATDNTDLAKSEGFQILSAIVASQANYDIWDNVYNSPDLYELTTKKPTIETESEILNKYLNGVLKQHESKVAERTEEITQKLPPYMRAAYDITIQDGKVIKEDRSYNLFERTPENQRKYSINQDKTGAYIRTEGKNNTEGENIIQLQEKKQETPIQLTNETIATYIGLMSIEKNMQGLTLEKIRDYIYAAQEKWVQSQGDIDNMRNLIQQAQTYDPTNQEQYKRLSTAINSIKVQETWEKENSDLEIRAKSFLSGAPSPENAKKLFLEKNNKNLANKILELVLNYSEELSKTQKNNFVTIIEAYIGEYKKDLTTEPLSFDAIKKSIKTGDTLPYNRPSKNDIFIISLPLKNGKNLEIFAMPMEEAHSLRTESISNPRTINIQGTEDTLQPYEIYDKTTTPWKTINIKTEFFDKGDFDGFIKKTPDIGAYKLFDKFIKEKAAQDPSFLNANLGSILNAVKNNAIYDKEITNGYYNTIAHETIRLTKDGNFDTLKTYLSYIKDNKDYIGTDTASQIKNRNVLALYGDNFIKENNDPELVDIKALYLSCKTSIDPNRNADFITQIGNNVDKFFETFGPMIGKLMEYMGYSKADIVKRLPHGVRGSFLEKFAEANKVSDKQKKDIRTIATEINFSDMKEKQTEIDTKFEKDEKGRTKDPQGKAEKIIQTIIEKQPENLQTSLENNFNKISPGLIKNTITAINKNQDTKIDLGQFVNNDGTIRENDKDPAWLENKKRIVKHIIRPDSTIRSSILQTHKQIIDNRNVAIDNEKTQDINRTTEKRSIETFDDVKIYLAAYVVTFDKPPFQFTMSENNLNLTNMTKETTLTATEKHNKSLKWLQQMLDNGKYKDEGTDVDLPNNYTAGDNNFDKYNEQVLYPIQNALSATALDDKTFFSATANNENFLQSLSKKPQVLKDLIIYMANSKEKDEKTNLEAIAKEFITKETRIVDTITLLPNQDKSELTLTVNDKKFTIKPGPAFEKVTTATS